MADAALAAFLSSDRVLVLPLMVTYLGSKPRSTSTPSSLVGRSRTWPMVAFTSYPAPRYFPMVFALVGDSTMTRATLPSRARERAPSSLARLLLGTAVATGLGDAFLGFPAFPILPVPSLRSGRAFTVLFVRVAMASV